MLDDERTNAMIFILLALSNPFTRSEQADLLELNHHYDRNGCHVYDQLIVWRQNPATFRFEVASWTLCDVQDKYPTRMPSRLSVAIPLWGGFCTGRANETSRFLRLSCVLRCEGKALHRLWLEGSRTGRRLGGERKRSSFRNCKIDCTGVHC